MKRALFMASLIGGAIVACASFDQTGGPAATTDDAGASTDAATTPDVAVAANAQVVADGGFLADAAIEHVHAIGGCANRGWQICEDYEGALDLASLGHTDNNGALSIVSPGSGSDHALLAKIPNESSRAFYYVSYAGTPSTIAWSFDLQITSALRDSTQFVALGFTAAGGECAIQPSLQGGVLVIIEYCPSSSPAGRVDTNLAEFELSSVPDGGWINVALELDTPSKRFDAAVVYPDGTIVPMTATVSFTVGNTGGAQFGPGISYLRSDIDGGSTLSIDNFAADWK